MYCDFEFELIYQIKNVIKILSLSKILKNTIKQYGQNYYHENGLLSKLRDGPFYCGMSIVLNIPQFNMFIYCSLSTTIWRLPSNLVVNKV